MHPFSEMQSVYYQTWFLILRPLLLLILAYAQQSTESNPAASTERWTMCSCSIPAFKTHPTLIFKVHLSQAGFHSRTIAISMLHYSWLTMCNSLSAGFFSRSASDICLKQSGIVSLMVAFLNFSLKSQTELEFPLGSPDFLLYPFLGNCYTASAPAKEDRNDLSLLVVWLLGEFLH